MTSSTTNQNTVQAVDVKPKRKPPGPKKTAPIVNLVPGQKTHAPAKTTRSAKLTEAHTLLNAAHQRERTSQDEMARLRKQINDLRLKNDDKKQQCIACWAALKDDCRRQELVEKNEREERARVDNEINDVLEKHNVSDAEHQRLKAIHNDMLAQRESMDLSEEARNAQDAMSLADTAIASSVTGPDYIPVGKGRKQLKPKSPRYKF